MNKKFDKSEIIFAKPGDKVAFHKPRYAKTYGLRLFIGPNPVGPRGGRSGDVVDGRATKLFTRFAICADEIESRLSSYLVSLKKRVTLEVSWVYCGGKCDVQIIELQPSKHCS